MNTQAHIGQVVDGKTGSGMLNSMDLKGGPYMHVYWMGVVMRACVRTRVQSPSVPGEAVHMCVPVQACRAGRSLELTGWAV